MNYYEHARYRNCDGVVIATVDYNDLAVKKLIESKIPTVTLDYVFDGITAVLSDNVGGMEAIVQYVYDQGHRRIAMIRGEDTVVTQKRLASFYRMCKYLNLKINEKYMKEAVYHDTKCVAIATRELLELETRPTCIIFPDDFSFIGGMNEIERLGLSIPEDISVVGYDGILLSQVLRPKLTTYKQNAKKLGQLAAEKLIEEIENPKTFIPQQYVVNGEMLLGGTVKKI
jgi:LacI family transcriptional regulator